MTPLLASLPVLGKARFCWRKSNYSHRKQVFVQDADDLTRVSLLSLHWDGWEHAIYSPSFYILDFFLEDPFLF